MHGAVVQEPSFLKSSLNFLDITGKKNLNAVIVCIDSFTKLYVRQYFAKKIALIKKTFEKKRKGCDNIKVCTASFIACLIHGICYIFSHFYEVCYSFCC